MRVPGPNACGNTTSPTACTGSKRCTSVPLLSTRSASCSTEAGSKESVSHSTSTSPSAGTAIACGASAPVSDSTPSTYIFRDGRGMISASCRCDSSLFIVDAATTQSEKKSCAGAQSRGARLRGHASLRPANFVVETANDSIFSGCLERGRRHAVVVGAGSRGAAGRGSLSPCPPPALAQPGWARLSGKICGQTCDS